MISRFSIVAVDPGPYQSAVAVFQSEVLVNHFMTHNQEVLLYLQHCTFEHLAVECMQNYGATAGEEVFLTAEWAGSFIQAFCERDPELFTRISRPTVKKHICGTVRAGDAKVRAAIIEMYGGKEKAIGKKAKPGPLYGVKADIWAAIAVGLAWYKINPQKQT